MITVFSTNEHNFLVKLEQPTLEKALWIDMFDPTLEERLMVQKAARIELPLHHEMHQLEFSNRFYEEDDAIFLSIATVTKAAPLPESHVVTFILTKTQIITLRYSDPNPVGTFAMQAEKRHTVAHNQYEVFNYLFTAFVGRVADLLEVVGSQTEGLSIALEHTIAGSLYGQSSKRLSATLRDINKLENLLSKCFQSLSSLSLALGYLQQVKNKLTVPELFEQFDSFTQDIRTMHSHGDYLNQKLGFQLQSALGVINIQQNQIIKVFTVLAMIFMPPTLLASIYGMNFKHMPELSSAYGYPLAIGLMVISAFLPYRYFRKKGWI